MKKIIQNHSKSFKINQNQSKSFKIIQNHSKLYLILLIFTMSMITQSCSEQEIDAIPTPTNTSSLNELGEIKIVRKIDNPYSLTNMQKAYNSLYNNEMLKSGTLKSDSLELDSLVATHYYVRFLPKDSAEYEALKADTTLTLFPYPLDCELTAGTTFRDSTLSSTQITWQYTKVPTDYIFSDIEYQKLDELYIPVDLPTYIEPASLKSAGKSYDDLLNEAMILTGNATNDSSDLKRLFPKSWHPSATIYVWDDILGKCIPLVGVKVRARHLVHWSTESTDGNGYARLGKFYVKVNYSLIYEKADFDIRDGLIWQGIFNGPEQKSHWDLNITSGQSLQMATMFRAAYRFFYGNNLGLHRNMSVQKICYINQRGTGDYWGDLVEGAGLPDIRVYGYSSLDGSYNPTHRIFSVTSHELGHASHKNSTTWVWEYLSTSKIIYESWADCVEWQLTLQEYKERGIEPITTSNQLLFAYNNQLTKQSSWPTSGEIAYSPIFIDLIDNENQINHNKGGRPNDNITGYTLQKLSDIVKKSYGLSSLKTNLKSNKVAGVTDAQIDQLFSKYEEVWK